MILSISLDGYRFFFRMTVSDAMSSLNACQVLQILRVLSTRVLTSQVLYENEVKLKKHVNKPVNVFLRNTLVTTVGPVLSTYISINGFRSCVVYKFSCAGCTACYVGETTRHFNTRVREHLETNRASHIFKHQGIKSFSPNEKCLPGVVRPWSFQNFIN